MIYAVNAGGLGDVLTCISNGICIAMVEGPIQVSSYSLEKVDCSRVLTEVIGYFNVSNLIRLVPEFGNLNLQHVDGVRYWGVFRGPHVWEGDIFSNRICYQFDGVHRGVEKGLHPGEFEMLEGEFRGMELIKVGKELSLKECSRLISSARFFIGIDSGMAHLAYTTGCPAYLLRNEFFWDSAHENIYCRGKCRKIFKRMDHFLQWYRSQGQTS